MKINEIFLNEETDVYHRIDFIYSNGDVLCTELIWDDATDNIIETSNSGYYLTRREVSRMIPLGVWEDEEVTL